MRFAPVWGGLVSRRPAPHFEPSRSHCPRLTKSTLTFNSSNRFTMPCAFSIPNGSSRAALAPPAPFMSHVSRSCAAFLTGRTALYRASQLRKRFAKLRGRTTGDSLKRAVEVRHGLKSAGEGNFANSRIRIEQKGLRFFYSDSREVVDEIDSGRFLEHFAKVMPADISHVGNSPERQRLRLMVLDKLSRSGHIRGLILCAPYYQLIRQDRKVLRKNA